jgi:NADH-quinone oxidoreductase subunit M
MTTWPILSLVTFLPLLGALVIYLLARGNDEAANNNARWIALWFTLVNFAVSLLLVTRFDPANSGFQFVEEGRWLASSIA